MREPKLTEMLKGVTPFEFKKFGEFLNSVYHNKSRKVLQLYELIDNNLEEFDANSVTNEKIAKEIFSGENNSEAKSQSSKAQNKEQNVRTLISNFTALLEEFLILEEISKSEISRKIYLLKSLHDRNIIKAFDMTTKEITDSTKKDFNKNTDYYYNELTYKEIVLNYHGEDLDLDLDKSYYDMSESTDYLFIVTKLKVVNSVLSRKILSGGTVYKNFWGIEYILDYVEKNIDIIEKSHPIIYSEYKILMMVLKPDLEKHFHDLDKHVLSNISKHNEDELVQVYYSLSNYCVNKVAMGEDKFISSLNKIQRNFEKIGFYGKNKNIQYTDFLSVIICGLNMKDTKWVNYFFETYKSNIAHEVKRDTINLASALISFSLKKYKDCIEQLSKIGYKFTYFYLKSRETLIKVYYEQGQLESLESAIDAAKHYLKRHKALLSIHFERYILFLNYVSKLAKLDKKQKAEIKQLMKRLDENRSTIAREWLIEKIIELK